MKKNPTSPTQRVIPSWQPSPSNPLFYQFDESEFNQTLDFFDLNSNQNVQSDTNSSSTNFLNMDGDSENLNSKNNSSNSKEFSSSTQEKNKPLPLYKDDEVTIEDMDDLLFNQDLFENNIQYSTYSPQENLTEIDSTPFNSIEINIENQKSSQYKPIIKHKKHKYKPQMEKHLFDFVENYSKTHNGNIPNNEIIRLESNRIYNKLYRQDPKNSAVGERKNNNKYKKNSEQRKENNIYLNSLNENEKLKLREKFESEFLEKYKDRLHRITTTISLNSAKYGEWMKFIQNEIHSKK